MATKVWKVLKSGPHLGTAWVGGSFVRLAEKEAKYLEDNDWVESADALEYAQWLKEGGELSEVGLEDSEQTTVISVAEFRAVLEELREAKNSFEAALIPPAPEFSEVLSTPPITSEELATISENIQKNAHGLAKVSEELATISDHESSLALALKKTEGALSEALTQLDNNTPIVVDVLEEYFGEKLKTPVKYKGSDFSFSVKEYAVFSACMSWAILAIQENVEGNVFNWHPRKGAFSWVDTRGKMVEMDVVGVLALGKIITLQHDTFLRNYWALKNMDSLPDDWKQDKWWDTSHVLGA